MTPEQATDLVRSSMPLCDTLDVRAAAAGPDEVRLELDHAPGLCTIGGVLATHEAVIPYAVGVDIASASIGAGGVALTLTDLEIALLLVTDATVPAARSSQISHSGAFRHSCTICGVGCSRSQVASTVKPKPSRKQRASITQSRVERRGGRGSSGSATSAAGSSQRYSVVRVPTIVMLRG